MVVLYSFPFHVPMLFTLKFALCILLAQSKKNTIKTTLRTIFSCVYAILNTQKKKSIEGYEAFQSHSIFHAPNFFPCI